MKKLLKYLLRVQLFVSLFFFNFFYCRVVAMTFINFPLVSCTFFSINFHQFFSFNHPTSLRFPSLFSFFAFG